VPVPHDREIGIPNPLATFEDAAVIARLEQPSAAREALPRDCRIPPGRGWIQGISRARPLARRALSTLRPPRVAIRARKP
jgi:hypothetical protein